MRLWPFFLTATSMDDAKALLATTSAQAPVVQPNPWSVLPVLTWQGEVTAANAEIDPDGSGFIGVHRSRT